jgi:hypothetical protein
VKCYFVGSAKPYDYEYVETCFANSAKEAKKFMWQHSHVIRDECDGEYFNIRVSRKKDFDNLCDKDKNEAYIVKDNKTLRQMYYHLECDDFCISCGLASFEGEFPVCPECENCDECGHDDACKTINAHKED